MKTPAKTLIATVLAATVALTSTAAPAQAGNRDDEIAALLFGLATLAIIGKSIENDRRRDRDQAAQAQTPPRHAGIPPRQRNLPAHCLRRVQTNDGPVRMLGRRCLRNNYDFVHNLPQRCAIRVQGPNHMRQGYRPRCLERRGYVLARH